MTDVRLFTDLSREEKEILFEELKSLKLSCSPASMTVDEIEKLIADARATAQIETVENSEQTSTQTLQDNDAVNTTDISEAKPVQTENKVSPQKQKKKTEKDSFNGICISCGEKVFDKVCSGCGRKY